MGKVLNTTQSDPWHQAIRERTVSAVELQAGTISEVKNRGIAAIQKVLPDATAAAAVCGLVGAEPRAKHLIKDPHLSPHSISEAGMLRRGSRWI